MAGPARGFTGRPAALAASAANRLQMSRRIRLGAFFKRLHRSFDATCPMRHARGGETHFHAGQGSHQGKLIALPEVADAKYFACEFAQAGAERHVVSV